ncbi:MAG: S41 family peptidase [Clostridia bacterium]|nr:S41 family peptidase [Clostridia bacterium]
MKRLTCLVLIFLLVLCPVVQAEEATEKTPESATVIKALKSYILRNYQFKVDEGDLLDAVLEAVLKEQDDPKSFEFLADAMMSALDQHSLYFTPEEQREFDEYVDAEFGGVGVSLVMIDGYCTIMSVLDDSPAQKTTSLKVGDKIVKVNGADVVNMDIDLIINRTRGPVGEEVVLTILSEDGTEWECPVVRDVIVTPSVEYVVNETEDAAYMIISQFGLNTAQQFKECHAEIKAKGINKIIIDVRDNTGGYTQQAYEIASIFLPMDTTIFCEYMRSAGYRIPFKSKNLNPDTETQLVLLVNEYTASASEIITGALKESGRAKVIGAKTFGKGTMQTVTAMGDYGSVKLTIAEFTCPSGATINEVGIMPNIAVENGTRPIEDADLKPLSLTTKYKQGDEAEEVCAIKQRLSLLGLYSGDIENPLFDKDVDLAIRRFQELMNLYPYGVADINTQLTLQTHVKTGEMYVDNQFNRACKELGVDHEGF